MKLAIFAAGALFAASVKGDGAQEPIAARNLQSCQVCCSEFDSVVTCINDQVSVGNSAAVGGCTSCVDELIRSGSCPDILLETCSESDSCLCNSSCKPFTDQYLKCMKGVDCSSNTCTGVASTPTSVPAPNPDASDPTTTSQPPPEGSCTEDSDCGENGACAREEAISSADFVCCASGEKDEYSSSFGFACTELPIGAWCQGIGKFCASGHCGEDGLCAEKPEEVQDLCSLDSDCGPAQTGCVGGTCAGDVCGREEATTEARYVCCESRVKEWMYPGVGYVCTNLPSGSVCDNESALCESKSCDVNGFCAEEKLESGKSCREDDDGMCASNACGMDDISAWSPAYICCSSKGKVWSGPGGHACVKGIGESCNGNNLVCESGVCGVDNLCAGEKVGNGEPCRENEDEMCASNSCGVEGGYADYICCPSGEKTWSGFRYVCDGSLQTTPLSSTTTSTLVPYSTVTATPEDSVVTSTNPTTTTPVVTTTTTEEDLTTPSTTVPIATATFNENGASAYSVGNLWLFVVIVFFFLVKLGVVLE